MVSLIIHALTKRFGALAAVVAFSLSAESGKAFGLSGCNSAGKTSPFRWLDLKVLDCRSQDESHATVEFVARQKIAGRAYRLHEVSRFVLTEGHWYYLDGDIAAG